MASPGSVDAVVVGPVAGPGIVDDDAGPGIVDEDAGPGIVGGVVTVLLDCLCVAR